MMSNSHLPELSKIEAAQIAEIEKTEEECREMIASARAESQRKLAEIPSQLQDERRAVLDKAQQEAETEAEEIRTRAQKDSIRLKIALDSVHDRVVDELFRIVLPEISEQE